MSKMDCSFAERDSAIDLGDIIADFANADEDNSARIPVKKLADLFDTCANKNDDGMKVYLRVRPTSKPESTIFVESEQTIVTNAPDSSKRALYTKTESRHYMFTRVFDAHCDQLDVFEHVAQPLLQRLLNGENSVVFAYGMTNAGKTHTIQGTSHHPGLLPRLVSRILDHVAMHNGWELHASMLEVYQDNIYDLLGKKREKLSIRDGSGKVEVAKLSTHPVASTQDSFRLMDTAASKRSKSSTFLNTGSSRSHAVYTLTLTRPTDDGRDIMSTAFQLVDLAGAERSNRTKATLIQQKEANNINTSLMQLWRCLHAVKRKNQDLNGSMEIIPFRESKLTHLLMPILGRAGLSGVAMIACVNPQIDDYDETLTILGNASLASKIREFQDVGRVAAQQVPASVLAAQQQQAAAAAAAAAAAVAAAAAAAAPSSSAPKGIRLEDLKDYRDKHSTASATAGAKRKRTDSTSATSTTGHGKRVAPTTKALTVGHGHGHGHGHHSGTSSTRTSVAETVVSLASISSDDIADEQERKRLRTEVQSLRDLNEQLVQQSISREAEIRREVSEEMMTRSSHLLQQIQELRRQLDANENAHLPDVTKSVRKAKRSHQQMQMEEDMQQGLQEAEEELERVKAEHEIEVYKLRAENFRLREELARYKPMSVVQNSASKAKMMVPNGAGGGGMAMPMDGGSRSPNRSPNRSPLSPINSAKNSPVSSSSSAMNIAANAAHPNSGMVGNVVKHVQPPIVFDVYNQENRSAAANAAAMNAAASNSGMKPMAAGGLSPQQRLRTMKGLESQQQQQTASGTQASGNGYFTRLRSQFTRA